MTDKQRRFCEEYMIDMNATQAAIRAGYSPKTANEQGAQNLVKLSKYIDQLKAEQSRRTGVSADRVVQELAKLAFVNAGDLITENGELKADAERDDLAAVRYVKVKFSGDGDTETEVQLNDKLKALELLGKHLGIFNSGTASASADQLEKAKQILGGVDSVID